jgi:hypothetical protein
MTDGPVQRRKRLGGLLNTTMIEAPDSFRRLRPQTDMGVFGPYGVFRFDPAAPIFIRASQPFFPLQFRLQPVNLLVQRFGVELTIPSFSRTPIHKGFLQLPQGRLPPLRNLHRMHWELCP